MARPNPERAVLTLPPLLRHLPLFREVQGHIFFLPIELSASVIGQYINNFYEKLDIT
jgi:hypothetical protein